MRSPPKIEYRRQKFRILSINAMGSALSESYSVDPPRCCFRDIVPGLKFLEVYIVYLAPTIGQVGNDASPDSFIHDVNLP